MSYTSLKFFLFIAVVMLLYFGFPRKQYRWTILLGASYYFYLLISYRLVGYILFTTVSTFWGALQMERIARQAKSTLAEHKKDWDRETKKAFKAQISRRKRIILTAVLTANFGIMVFLKYYTPSADNQLHFWGQADRIAYIQAINTVLKDYLAAPIIIEKEGM